MATQATQLGSAGPQTNDVNGLEINEVPTFTAPCATVEINPMTDPVKAPQKRKAPSYVTKTTFEKSVVSITKLVEQCRNDILTLREKLLTDKPVDGRALPEISPNDDSWLWAY